MFGTTYKWLHFYIIFLLSVIAWRNSSQRITSRSFINCVQESACFLFKIFKYYTWCWTYRVIVITVYDCGDDVYHILYFFLQWRSFSGMHFYRLFCKIYSCIYIPFMRFFTEVCLKHLYILFTCSHCLFWRICNTTFAVIPRGTMKIKCCPF